MNTLFSPEGEAFRFLCRLADLCIVSLLWAVCCLPLVTIGPATAALYHTAVTVIRGERSEVFADYFHAFRLNLRQGCVLTLVFGAYFALVWAGVALSAQMDTGTPLDAFYPWLARAMAVPGLLPLPYIFAYLSRVCNTIGGYITISLLLAIRHIPSTLVLLAVLGTAAWALYSWPVTVVFAPGLAALLASFPLEAVFARHMPAPPAGDDADGSAPQG